MKTTMRIGTVGNGVIVSGFVDAVNKTEGASIEAIYIRPHNLGKGYEQKFGTDIVYTIYDDLLADESLNFIYIALPNSLHYPYAKRALEAGKNVILEKPFASNLKEAQTLIDLAQSKQLFLFEAISVIHMPNFKVLKESVDKLGSLSLIQANYSQYSSKYPLLKQGEHPNVFNLEYSGGCLMDLNYYNLYAVIGLFGKPNKVSYTANTHSNGIDLSGTVVLTYPNLVATLSAAKDSRSFNYFQIQGDEGFVMVVDGINGVSKIELNLREGQESVNLQDEPNRLYYEAEAFSKVFQENDLKTCYEWLDMTKSVMEVVEASLRDIDVHYESPELI